MKQSQISVAITSSDFKKRSYTQHPHVFLQNGYQAARSGNVYYASEVFTQDAKYKNGASHGSPYAYDRQVPLIFYGRGISKGKTHFGNVDITQIAPTLSDLLKIGRTPFCTSSSLTDVVTTP